MQRLLTALLLLAISVPAWSAEPAISGTVTDSLGAVIPGATVVLMQDGKDLHTATTDSAGKFQFKIEQAGRYAVRAEAKTFAASTSQEVFAEPGHGVDVSLTLSPSVVAQNIVVTATGLETPEAQTGTSISVINSDDLSTRIDLQGTLRDQVGGQITQSGQMGALTALYVRGGPSDANKVLVDGIPINDVGGSVDFSYLQADGFERVEFQRGPNSALYGSDALASVVSITIAAWRHSVAAVHLWRRRRNLWHLSRGWQRRRLLEAAGLFHRLFGIRYAEQHSRQPVPSRRLSGQPGISARPEHHPAGHRGTGRSRIQLGQSDCRLWHSRRCRQTISGTRFSASRWTTMPPIAGTIWCAMAECGCVRQYNDWSPTGIPFDPYGLGYPSYYLGAPVTQQGANGYTITPAAVAQVEPSLAAPGAGDFSVRRSLSAAVVVPDQHQLRLCPDRLPGQRKADRSVRLQLHQRDRFHL